MRHSRPLAIGQLAPDFAAPVTGADAPLRLSDFRDRAVVVLAFYPGDWTNICSQELPILDDSLALGEGIQILGISVDSAASHTAYTRYLGLSRVRLVSDFDRTISRAYGLLRPEGVCERATVVVDKAGRIAWMRIEPELQQQRAVSEIGAALAGLGAPGAPGASPNGRLLTAQLTRSTPLATPTLLTLKFWGTRGSIPTCGPAFARYGGNTSCVSLQSDSGHLFIFDSGTGIRELGLALQPPDGRVPPPYDTLGMAGYLLLSHTHWDHIQGFPFFEPAFNPHNQFSVVGCSDCAQALATIMAGQMEQKYFPVSLDGLPARFQFYSCCDTSFTLDGARVTTLTLQHPNPSTAFRLDLAGRAVVYATDHEVLQSPPLPITDRLLDTDVLDARLIALAEGADVLIHDAQYTAEEYPEKIHWGHCTVEAAVDTAIRARVRRLFLYHHDPQHTDADLDAMLATARRRAARLSGGHLEVYAAADRDEWVL